MSVRARRRLLEAAPVVLLLLLLGVFAAIDDRIVAPGNLGNIVVQASPIALLALGAFVVLLSGGIDLSAGHAAGLTSVVIAAQLVGGASLVRALLLGLAVAGAVGLVNGLLVGATRLPPFAATLGTMTIVQGITLFVATDAVLIVTSEPLRAIGQGTVGPIPTPVLLAFGVAVVVWFVMRYTRFGVRDRKSVV